MDKVKNGDKVKIHYTGKFKDGELFDTSRERQPLEFIVGNREMMPGIENGVIGRAIKNLRFTVSLPDLLHNIHMIGDTCEIHAFGKFPHMIIKDFVITGSTG